MLGLKENTNILQQLLPLCKKIPLLSGAEQSNYSEIFRQLEYELHGIYMDFQHATKSLLEENNFASIRQTVLLMEITYLFSFFLLGLNTNNLEEFSLKTKEFVSSLTVENNILRENKALVTC